MDIEQFQQKFLPLKNKMYRYAYTFLADDDEAMDAVQDAFLKIWDKKRKWSDIRNHEAWSMQIIRNLCLDRIKSGNFKKIVRGTEIDDHLAAVYPAYEEEEMARLVEKLIDKLPSKQREAMALRDQEGYNYQEISEIMSIEMSQVKICIYRARKYIRKELIRITTYGTAKDQ